MGGRSLGVNRSCDGVEEKLAKPEMSPAPTGPWSIREIFEKLAGRQGRSIDVGTSFGIGDRGVVHLLGVAERLRFVPLAPIPSQSWLVGARLADLAEIHIGCERPRRRR